MRRLVSVGAAMLIGGCGTVLDFSDPPPRSPLLPRDAFGPGAATTLDASPVHYTGEARSVAVERLEAPRGAAFYIDYRLDGPNASLVLVVADRESGVTARPSSYARWAQTTTYRRFSADSGAFRSTTFATELTRCLWFERIGVDDPAVWGAYCVDVDAPPPEVIRNKILRGVEVRALVDVATPALGSDEPPAIAEDDFDFAPPDLGVEPGADTPPPIDERVAVEEPLPPEEARPERRPSPFGDIIFYSLSENARSGDAPPEETPPAAPPSSEDAATE